MRRDSWGLGLAGAFAAFAAATLGLWIPGDVESGMVETFRRRTSIGDAMAPTAAAAGMLAAAVALGCAAALRPRPAADPLDRNSLLFIVRIAAVVGAGLVLMAHAGPLVVEAVNALGGGIGSYRELRDTFPYKFLGYVLGGAVMVAGMIAVIEQRLSAAALVAAAIATLALAVLYDVPFDDLLLPPNGDQ